MKKVKHFYLKSTNQTKFAFAPTTVFFGSTNAGASEHLATKADKNNQKILF